MDRHGIRDYADLLRRSTQRARVVLAAVLDDLDIEFYEPYTQVMDTSRGIAWPRWCVGGRMNIVHNCLDKWTRHADRRTRPRAPLGGRGGHDAHAHLRGAVARREPLRERAAGARRRARATASALFMPMCPELVAAFFAVIKIGGIVLPLFSGYGADAVATRLQDAGAVASVTADGFWRRGQPVLMKPTADAALAAVAVRPST